MSEQEIYKRFMVFASNDYEAQHGTGDCYGSFDTIEDAMKYCNEINFDTVDIFDRIEGKIIYEKP
jgi:hypothetical protein